VVNNGKLEAFEAPHGTGLAFRQFAEGLGPGKQRVGAMGAALMMAPCGNCPRAARCSLSGPFNPHTCDFLTRWLSGDIEGVAQQEPS
jgi:hypothetical protein